MLMKIFTIARKQLSLNNENADAATALITDIDFDAETMQEPGRKKSRTGGFILKGDETFIHSFFQILVSKIYKPSRKLKIQVYLRLPSTLASAFASASTSPISSPGTGL